MQVDFVHTLHTLFQQETTAHFRQYYRNRIGKVRKRLSSKNEADDERLEISVSETNETTQHHLPEIPEQAEIGTQQEETMQSTFKSLTGSEVLKIYADAQFFNELLSNQQEYPRQIDQILWRVTYLLGQVLMQIQNSLIEQGFLQHSVILSVREIKQAAFKLVQSQVSSRQKVGVAGLQEIKSKMVDIFQGGHLQLPVMIMVYNYVIGLWKPPMEFTMEIQPNTMMMNVRPETQEQDMQTDPVVLPTAPMLPKSSMKHYGQNRLTNTNNGRLTTSSTHMMPPRAPINKYPPNFDLQPSKNFMVSQVTAYTPKESTPGKQAIQNTIKRAKSRINSAERPLHMQNRKIRQKLNNINDIYCEEEIDRSGSPVGMEEEVGQQHVYRNPDKVKQVPKGKAMKSNKLDAVRDKMNMLHAQLAQSTQNNNHPNHDKPYNSKPQQQRPVETTFQGQVKPNSNMMDLCSPQDKIMLDQNRNRLISRQMSGFRPPIIENNKYDINQKLMKGSFGPNFTNKMMVPTQLDRRIFKQGNGSVDAHKSSSSMLFRQPSLRATPPKISQPQGSKNTAENQIIDLNANKPACSTDQNNPDNLINLRNPATIIPSEYEPKSNPKTAQHGQFQPNNVKLQEKIEDSTYNTQEKPQENSKLNIPEEILSRPTSIEPITIPIIAEDSNYHPHHDKPQQKETTDTQKEDLRRMRERWNPEQEKILTQCFIQKGDEVECSKKLHQLYGPQNPKHSPAGIRIKIDSIVRKVYQKFCSLNTKNENIRKFKQNWEFIRKRSSLPVRRRIYREIVAIYTAMLNMSEEKRQVISSKIVEINRICQYESSRSAPNTPTPPILQSNHPPQSQ